MDEYFTFGQKRKQKVGREDVFVFVIVMFIGLNGDGPGLAMWIKVITR